MSFIKLIIFILCFHFASVCAATINCEPPKISGGRNYDQWSEIHAPFELKPSGAASTLGANIKDWAIIYSVQANIGMSTTTCSSSTDMYFTLLTQAEPIGVKGGVNVYSTDVPGIGISISSNELGLSGVASYPTALYFSQANVGYGFWATITYYKIPGQIPMNRGNLTVTGPEAAVVYMKSGSTFTSSQADRITSDNKAYISSSRILTVSMLFQPGTCNIEGDNVKVNMGNYNEQGDGHSDWKDASFKLACPDGLGYGSNATEPGEGYDFPFDLGPVPDISSNVRMNGKVTISIVPYTEVIDANKGIVALDGTGAKGYGIQLAWGDYSSQSSVEPANPVVLNSSVDANSLNSGFGAGFTLIGGNAFNGTDNTIKMAARYIRTTGDPEPGPANAVVQVIANYQ